MSPPKNKNILKTIFMQPLRTPLFSDLQLIQLPLLCSENKT